MIKFCRLKLFIVLLSILIANIAIPAWGADQNMQQANTEELTLDQAIELALKNSIKVQQEQLNVDRALEVREYWWDAYNWQLSTTYDPMSKVYSSVPSSGDSYPVAIQTDRDWYIKTKALQIARDGSMLEARARYYNVLKALEKYETAKATLQRDELNLNTIKAMVSVGMKNQIDLIGAETSFKNSQAEHIKALNNINESYRALNKLIGLPIDKQPLLKDKIDFKPLEVDSLENEIQRVLSTKNNPYLWMKEAGYDMSEYLWSYTDPDEAGRVDIDKSKLDYNDAIRSTKEAMYSLYDQISNVESAYKTAEQSMRAAEESLRIKKIQYKLGMITGVNVVEAEVSLANARNNLQDLASQHWSLKETFQKPWLQ